MFVRKDAAPPRKRATQIFSPEPYIGQAVASSSPSSSSAAAAAATASNPAAAVAKLTTQLDSMTVVRPGLQSKPSRERAPHDPNNPELTFLDEISQAAFDSKCDNQWLENNADFSYCGLHKQVCEMIRLHPEANYNPDCQRCLKHNFGGLMNTFFQREGQNFNIDEAQAAWLSIQNQKQALYKEAANNPSSANKMIVKNFDLKERASWLRYAFLAWEINKYRVKVTRECELNGMESPAFTMLPSSPDRNLTTFVSHATVRNMQTQAGRQGGTCNVKACDMHSADGNPRFGHAIQVFNKSRYFECGICVLPRESAQLQRQMDAYNDRAQMEERAAFVFDKRNTTAQAGSAPVASSSSSAAAAAAVVPSFNNFIR